MMFEWDPTTTADTDRLVACPARNVDEDKRARFVAQCTHVTRFNNSYSVGWQRRSASIFLSAKELNTQIYIDDDFSLVLSYPCIDRCIYLHVYEFYHQCH